MKDSQKHMVYGVALIIDQEVKKKLLSLHKEEIYAYVIYDDEITRKLIDCMELDQNRFDSLNILMYSEAIPRNTKHWIARDYDGNGSSVCLLEARDLSWICKRLQAIDQNNYSNLYQRCGIGTMTDFEENWSCFCAFRDFIFKAKNLRQSLVFFYG